MDSAGQPAADSQCAVAALKPTAEQLCAPQPCNFCASNSCFGNGYCTDGACQCSPDKNVTGAYCQIPLGCASGVIDAKLACCASGVVNAAGACCPAGAVLDAPGACCAGGAKALDACGVCGGDGKFVDVSGACCSTLLDADGLCCNSGALDECGVCDGLGNSCGVDLSLSLSVSSSVLMGDAIQAS